MPKPGATWFKEQGAWRCQRCGGRATGELMNSYNASMGMRCKRCAIKEIEAAQAPEKDDARPLMHPDENW